MVSNVVLGGVLEWDAAVQISHLFDAQYRVGVGEPQILPVVLVRACGCDDSVGALDTESQLMLYIFVDRVVEMLFFSPGISRIGM